MAWLMDAADYRPATEWRGTNPFVKQQSLATARDAVRSRANCVDTGSAQVPALAPRAIPVRPLAVRARADETRRANARASRIQPVDGLEALLQLLNESLDKGHWRVATRRYLMLTSRGYELAPQIRERCERLVAGLTPRELHKIEADAKSWAELTAADIS